MARGIDGIQTQPYRYLLCDFYSKHDIALFTAAAATAFVEQYPGTFENFRMIFNQPSHSKITASFFICGSEKNDISVQYNTRTMQTEKGRQLNNAEAFHIASAAAKNITITNFAG